jgi:hypothetical protein
LILQEPAGTLPSAKAESSPIGCLDAGPNARSTRTGKNQAALEHKAAMDAAVAASIVLRENVVKG